MTEGLEEQGPISAGEPAGQSDPGSEGTQIPEPSLPEAPDKGQAEETPRSEPGTRPEPAKPPKADEAGEETFFDPKELDPSLVPAYKQMQGQFTKKMMGISGDRQKVEAYDAFMADPMGQIRSIATQQGFQIVPTGQQAAETTPQQEETNWEPKTYEELLQRGEERAEKRIMAKLAPILGNVQKLTASNVESQLNEIDGNWKVYEHDMMSNLRAHPTLVGNVSALYRMSVPEEILASRATQAALKKMDLKVKSARVSGSSTTKSSPTPRTAHTFDEAVQVAKEVIAKGQVLV